MTALLPGNGKVFVVNSSSPTVAENCPRILTPPESAESALQEDVDVVGLSILSGAHMTLFPRVRQLLDSMGRPDVLVTGGGIIPAEDMDALRQLGIGRLFGPGTRTSDLVEFIREWFQSRQTQEA